MLKAGKSGLEGCMTDDRLVGGGDRDDHHKQGLRVEGWRGGGWRGEGWRKRR
jgi:hypothetical protein